jgi:hypothetical protein
LSSQSSREERTYVNTDVEKSAEYTEEQNSRLSRRTKLSSLPIDQLALGAIRNHAGSVGARGDHHYRSTAHARWWSPEVALETRRKARRWAGHAAAPWRRRPRPCGKRGGAGACWTLTPSSTVHIDRCIVVDAVLSSYARSRAAARWSSI